MRRFRALLVYPWEAFQGKRYFWFAVHVGDHDGNAVCFEGSERAFTCTYDTFNG